MTRIGRYGPPAWRTDWRPECVAPVRYWLTRRALYLWRSENWPREWINRRLDRYGVER